MKIVFFGSDAFAVPTLTALAEAGHEVALVITNPDRRRGRKKTLLPTPVKEEAQRLGVPVLQPEGRPKKADAASIRESGAELGVVVAYGQFLGRRVRGAPSLGYSINLHASLLPRWRGAAPVAAAILAGDAVSGVCVQRVEHDMDAGPLLASHELPIGPTDTRGGLRDRLSEIGASIVSRVVAKIAAGEATFTPQDEARVTQASMLGKQDGLFSWDLPAVEIDRKVRGLSPWPTAFVELEGGRLQILEARLAEGEGEPGVVLSVGKGGIVVAVGDGALELRSVKPDGKRAMDGVAWANGRRLEAGSRL